MAKAYVPSTSCIQGEPGEGTRSSNKQYHPIAQAVAIWIAGKHSNAVLRHNWTSKLHFRCEGGACELRNFLHVKIESQNHCYTYPVKQKAHSGSGGMVRKP